MNFCLCCHPQASHINGYACTECNCQWYAFDPYLQAGSDGKPVTTMLRPADEYGPLELVRSHTPNPSHPVMCGWCWSPMGNLPGDTGGLVSHGLCPKCEATLNMVTP